MDQRNENVALVPDGSRGQCGLNGPISWTEKEDSRVASQSSNGFDRWAFDTTPT
jgi:hypothetical protein